MSRPTKVPSYRKHSLSNQAVVTLNVPAGRKDVLLGAYGTLQSHVEYARVIAEWAGTVSGSRSGDSASQLTINELVLSFWRYAESYFQKPDGTPTSEIHNYRAVIRDLRQMYGHTLTTRKTTQTASNAILPEPTGETEKPRILVSSSKSAENSRRPGEAKELLSGVSSTLISS